MAVIKGEKFEQSKVDRLKHYIQKHAEKSKPKYYEIFVDNLKVVDKTNDPNDFDSYEDYISDDTDHIRIVIYYHEKSPRNEQYKYNLKEKVAPPVVQPQPVLNGVEILNQFDEKLKIERERWDTDLLKKENLELKEKLKEAEDYVDELLEKYQNIKFEKSSLSKNWGEFGGVALEAFVRKNPTLIGKIIPGGEALAGMIEQDNKEQQEKLSLPQSTNDSEVTFSKKENATSSLSKEDQENLQIIRQLQGTFDEKEIVAVMQILDRLAADTSKVNTVLELLNEPEGKQTTANNLSNNFKTTDNEEI